MENPMTQSHIFWNPRHLLAVLALGVFALLVLLVPSSASAEPDGSDVPLSFTPNAGQTDDQVRYLAQGEGYAFFFTDEKAVLSFAKPAGENQAASDALVLDLRFVGTSPAATLEARERAAGTLNRLPGERSEWKTSIPTYEELVYRDLWAGIDMVIRGAAGELKYEFHVSPGADARDIRLAYGGADGLSLADEGSLSIATALGELTDAPPVSYQRAAGERVPVETAYALDDGNQAYGFTVGSGYDPDKPLVIDPSIDYSTFLGGAGSDAGRGIAVDAKGNAYVTGQTASLDFPTTVGAFARTNNLNTDVFVTKLNNSGSSIVWSTFVGGSAFDSGNAIAVDGQGAAYVSGFSGSLNYPTTAGAFDRTQNGGSDAFVTKLDPSGSALAYSTYLGGAGFSFEGSNGIAVDDEGSAYVTGFTNSAAFPTTPGAYDTTHAGSNDVYVTKLDRSGSTLVYSTLLGGSTIDTGNAITLDDKRNAYVTGFAASADFPTTPGAVDTTHNGGRDAFVTKLDATGSTLSHSTFLGGTGTDSGAGIAVDDKRQVAYVAGSTDSADYPTTPGASDPDYGGGGDAFVSAIDASGSVLVNSTHLGGTASDAATGIATDAMGKWAWITGSTSSADFPITPDAEDPSYNGNGDAFATRFHPTQLRPAYSTFLGGLGTDVGNAITIDERGKTVFVTGSTESGDYLTTSGAYQESKDGAADGFVTKVRATDD
jgi:Beta-propeller repeat